VRVRASVRAQKKKTIYLPRRDPSILYRPNWIGRSRKIPPVNNNNNNNSNTWETIKYTFSEIGERRRAQVIYYEYVRKKKKKNKIKMKYKLAKTLHARARTFVFLYNCFVRVHV
jgi:hypothetical protein